MKVLTTSLPGVLLFELDRYGDERGFFVETYRADIFRKSGLDLCFVQDNHSRSSRGVLRGLHYQLVQPQGKLVRVARGAVFDVAVDVRSGSPTFGEWYGTTLDDCNMRMMYIPPGFAHGFVVLTEFADFIYKCTDYYHPQSEHGILWNDPDIGIKWPVSDVNLSGKDADNPLLRDCQTKQLPPYHGEL